MPTIKDIAREAGVSHGTVSNVINGRGNVSVEKMRMVWQAAEKLGYKVNAKAQSLRQGRARSVAILLPGIEYEQYACMYEVFQSELVQQGYSVQLYSTRSMEAVERDLLKEALSTQVSAVIASSCLPDAPAYYRGEAPELPLVFLQYIGPLQSDTMYAGFDMERAGREIARYIQKGADSCIGVFTDADTLPDAAAFLKGFHGVCKTAGVPVRTLSCPNYQVDLRAFEFFDPDQPYGHMVCTDRRRAAALRAACTYASEEALSKCLTIAPRTAVTDPDEPIYELDYKRLAHRVVGKVLARLDGDVPLPGTLHMFNSGFRAAPAAPAVPAVRELRMLTMASPSTTALRYLLPYLKKGAGIRLELTVLPSLQDVYSVLQTAGRSRYDLIRIDVAWMEELAEKVFLPLEQIPFDWNALLSNAIPELRQNYSTVRDRLYCVPYDPSTQLLFYRKDLFSDPTYKRMYYERFKRELTVPETFAQYNQIAGFFTRSRNPASPVQYGSTVAIGNVVVSPSEFLPRLFAEGGGVMDAQGRITLDTPEALRALKNYQETYACADRTVYDFWKNVLEGFADGSAAMTVVFMNYASHILNLKMSSIAGKLGFAPVPGNMPLLGGGVVGVTKECACPDTACAFLSWLYSDSVAPVFTMLGGLSPCRSAYSNRDISEKYPWLSVARESFTNAQRRGGSGYYSNFSELQLETILASHVQKAVLGIASPEESLRQAQRECESLFHKL